MPKITMPSLHSNQVKILNHPARFRIISAGRRFGKTSLGVGEGIFEAYKGGLVWWVAPSYALANVGWRMAQKLVMQIPGTHLHKSDRIITFPSGGTLQVRTAANPELLRSEGLDLVILDEAAFMLATVWIDVIQPALGDKLGRAIFISTPNGRNWFWNVYIKGLDPLNEIYHSFQYSTLDNPFFPAAEFERLRNDMPEDSFAQEHLAQFIDDAGLVFRKVASRIAKGVEYRVKKSRTYVFGIDWGRYHDFTVIAVFEVETRRMVDMMRFNRISWRVQREYVQIMFEKWGPVVILAEQNSIGDVQIEALQEMGLPVKPFMTTQKSKANIIEHLALGLERELVTLYDDEQLKNEMIAYTMERKPSGFFSYQAPDGFFDDCVIATALADWATQNETGIGI